MPNPKKTLNIREDDNQEDYQYNEDIEQPKTKKKKLTIETHQQKYDDLLELINFEIDRKKKNREGGIRILQNIKNKTSDLKNESQRLNKKKTIRRKNTTSGLNKRYKISTELREFLMIDDDYYPTRTDVTRAISAYIKFNPDEKRDEMLKWEHLNPDHIRNLQNPLNKKEIIPDKTLSDLLDYPEYVKNVKNGKVFRIIIDEEGEKIKIPVTDKSLTYCTIQKLINKHFIESISTN